MVVAVTATITTARTRSARPPLREVEGQLRAEVPVVVVDEELVLLAEEGEGRKPLLLRRVTMIMAVQGAMIMVEMDMMKKDTELRA
jgi:hypothetical protein